MSRFYMRQFELSVDNKTLISKTSDKQFRVTFNITLEYGSIVSYADIAISNLSESTAQKSLKKGSIIEFSAGYEDTIDRIFKGRIINSLRERQGATTITRLICRGGTQPRNSSVELSLGKDASVVQIVRECIKSAGYSAVMTDDDFKDSALYPRGYALHGDPIRYLTELSQAHDFEFLIDGDAVVVTAKKSTRRGKPLVVSQFTGMIGIPEITEVGCDVQVKLNPAARIGGTVDIKSELATFNFGNLYYQDVPASAGKGIYKIYKIEHSGDSYGDEWTTKITGFRY